MGKLKHEFADLVINLNWIIYEI